MKFFTLLLPFLLVSCFKTAEQIKREEQVDLQLKQSQKLVSELSSQVQVLQNQLAVTTGQIEELDHTSKKQLQDKQQTYAQSLEQINEKLNLIEEDNKKLNEKLVVLQNDVNAQKSYIKKVTGTLSKMSGTSTRSSASQLQEAHKQFEKNNYDKAKDLYLQVLSDGKINNAQKNHVRFNVGLISYMDKKYDEGLVYFSKIYTKWPKSSFAPRSLLYIARSFDKLGKKDEAAASYQELINNYPQSNHAKTAKKEMN
ncbi:MAG: hypothetical protein CME62_17515 [Halobacteriovoraceae bacterium]|nr:hypothetical protein [Halobacteriovoraceae bacterium]|tara:strand:- start:37940 stop:38704 length:765 start_codon:yes stop_codon:yes gene_type:complete